MPGTLSFCSDMVCRVQVSALTGEKMHIAVRSTVATGVAMVGAGAIALAPIHPVGPVALPLSEINVPAAISTMEVELAALPNPISPWVNVFTTAVTNAGVLGTAWLDDPAP